MEAYVLSNTNNFSYYPAFVHTCLGKLRLSFDFLSYEIVSQNLPQAGNVTTCHLLLDMNFK